MKFKLMERVYIASDTLNFGVPVGSVGYVTVIDRHIDQCCPYLIRVPEKKQAWWLPECDLIAEADWTSSQADTVIRESLVNHALDTGNVGMLRTLADKAVT